ncbi:major facilitator superfamily domain-containing protein [Staphylotrichum tortipilum]|uniref:Major facilitator superfamily domain-containing protein n=1 Tax=Staphylotrichum tortipilum TaxID=2831512 RepID=A0AAN6RTI1_9PEZI|nr:major facilitator superfamily domain-containing protein [Staphylotrichum longicolle]
MRDTQLHRARLVSSVAATMISLACGTNYVYSAWAPQFADRLHLTTTETNLIGLAGNMGMYSMGVPVGLFVDNRGPRPAVIAGALCLGIGYVPFRAAYETASGSVPMLCFFAYLTGLGGCMAFAASVKTSALNWPHHRGTATAFPLAAFGLSAFFFSLFGGVFFPGNTSAFLSLLAAGTFTLIFVGFFFLKVYPHTSYHSLPTSSGPSGLSDSQQLRRTPSQEDKAARRQAGTGGRRLPDAEPGTSPTTYTTPAATAGPSRDPISSLPEPDDQADVEAFLPRALADTAAQDPEADETSSLMSKSPSSSLAGDVYVQSSVNLDRSHRIDIRGWRLLRNVDFWQLFCIMGILAGIGLMTINNIGHDVNALWKRYDDSVDEAFLVQRQQMHVSILSVGSFCGRLLSGVGSDFLVKVLRASRAWCLVIACLVFCIAQLCALSIENPHLLGFVSGLSGLGYGFLFGVFPSIVAESFGIHGLSQNWGFMTLSPVISGNIFNLFYGVVFDNHSIVGPDGERSCPDGLDCYKDAYFVTLAACGLGIVVTLSTIRNQYRQRLREEGKGAAED